MKKPRDMTQRNRLVVQAYELAKSINQIKADAEKAIAAKTEELQALQRKIDALDA